MGSVPSPTWVSTIDAERPIIGKDLGLEQKTFNQLVREQVSQFPDRPQYVTTDGTKYTLAQFYSLASQVAKAMIGLGLEPYDGVAIHAFNSIQWFAVDVGASLAACIPTGIYTTNKPDLCAYILRDSNSRLVFVDEESALDKFLSVRDDCGKLSKIIMWASYDKEKYAEHSDLVMSWEEFLEFSSNVSDDDLEERMIQPKPEMCCKLIYTSGTTGPPKAVMISHDNLVFISVHFGRICRVKSGDRIISFLPLSHIAANAVDICGSIASGYTMYLADRNALRGTLAETMKKVRPTVFLGVPRVYEKIQEGMQRVGASSGRIKRAIADWAKDVGRRASTARDRGSGLPLLYPVANALVFSNVHKALGLDECKMLINASAPMQSTTDEYFKSLNFRIVDLYGMSEATGPITFNFPEYRPSTSGKLIGGVEVKIVDEIAPGEGELCFRGRNMFMGYLNNPEETAKTMDDEGYIHSGDIGRIDDGGFITITGRAKDLLVTSGGENVAPFFVESSLISAMPAISRAFAIGDHRKFVSALLVPCIGDDGKLDGAAASVNPNIKTPEEAVKDEQWMKYLQRGVEEANEDAVSNAAKVKKFQLLKKDFSIDNGELTPTMKVKRKIVVENYSDVIESMYQ